MAPARRARATELLLAASLLCALCAFRAPLADSTSGAQSAPQKRARRAATARQDRLWDDAVIPYEIDSMFSDERAALFRSAMRHWEQHTCVKFVERQPDEHRNYIVFTERSCGCCSFVGKRGNGPQAISIGKHCDKFGIVVHELGHVVGFWHEHTRPDRDQHVQIVAKNIMAGQEYNFNKLTKDEVNSLGLAYDYDSILHYANNTFARDPYLDTIVPLHGHLNTEEATTQPPLGSNQHLPPSASTTTTTTATATSTSATTSTTTVVTASAPSSTTTKLTNITPNPTNNLTSSNSKPVNATTANVQMINDKLAESVGSMLSFGPSISRSSTRNTFAALIDGKLVVPAPGARLKRSLEHPDIDDGHHMLAMDNMLARLKPEIGQRVRLSVGDIAQTNLLYKCPRCGRTIQQPSGIFHAPNYYSNPNNVDKKTTTAPGQQSNVPQTNSSPARENFCEWRLTVGLGERILINITDLDIAPPSHSLSDLIPRPAARIGYPRSALSDSEAHEFAPNNLRFSPTTNTQQDPMIMQNCFSDYIEIRDGYTYKAPVIARLCGQFLSISDRLRPIVSTSNRILVSYKYLSASLDRRGFMARHETVCGGVILLGNAYYSENPFNQVVTSSSPPSTAATPTTINHRSQTHRIQTSVTTTVPSATTTTTTTTSVRNINRILTNGSSSSENEVLLSSQNHLRYNQLQSQQANTNHSDRLIENPTTTPVEVASSHNPTTNGKDRDKLHSYLRWPAINASVIYSPGWPENYGPSKECIWRVKADENHQISVKFDSFDLESHYTCAYDYIEVLDGPNLDSPVIGRYCGTRVPDQILSSGQTLLLKFVSDSDVNRAGFMANLQPELDECKLGMHGCSYKCSNAAIPYRCECPFGLELAADGKNCIPPCGGIRNDTTGQITSPSFPDSYPINTKCVWELIAPPHHRITINFTHFDLEGIKGQECDYDFVDIRSMAEDGKLSKNGVFCGPHQDIVVTSIANTMRIEFNSDNSIQRSGFVASYFTDSDECAINNGGCQHLCSNTIGSYQCSCNNGFVLHENRHDCFEGHCTYSILVPEGTFQSPNFPSQYQPNKECAWVFSTAPGHRIRLVFDQFDLESHQECAYDHVAVFDGESIDDPALGRFCGSRRPLTLISSFNMLYLLFRSDATNEKKGFNGSHSTVCGGRLQANLNQNDLIYSHPLFDGTTHYNRNEDCEWLIEANYNQKVRVEFTYFALEADTNCNYDLVTVYDGSDDTANQMARLCGADLPKEHSRLVSSGESMLIVFRSDDSINNKGFSLTYTATEISEDEAVAITYPTGTKITQSS